MFVEVSVSVAAPNSTSEEVMLYVADRSDAAGRNSPLVKDDQIPDCLPPAIEPASWIVPGEEQTAEYVPVLT